MGGFAGGVVSVSPSTSMLLSPHLCTKPRSSISSASAQPIPNVSSSHSPLVTVGAGVGSMVIARLAAANKSTSASPPTLPSLAAGSPSSTRFSGAWASSSRCPNFSMAASQKGASRVYG